MPDPITFCEFMRTALYDQARGYYMTEREHFGRVGDYNTTSQYHELFGEIMARQFADLFRELGCPPRFTIVELGPGNGDFAWQVLTEMRLHHEDAFQCLHYLCCEISQSLRKRQRDRLNEFSDRVAWIEELDEIDEPIVGVFFANEFFDALPVHVIRQRGSDLAEVHVAESPSGEFSFSEQGLSSPQLDDFWDLNGVPLADGQIAEINLEAVDWLRRIAEKLAVGRLVTIDYGDLADRLYNSSRLEGTIRCFAGHRLGDAPLDRIGEQDLTSSVNFTALIEYGREFGLEAISLEGQAEYLMRHGLLERAAKLAKSAGHETPAALEHRLAVKQLFVPHGIAGYFKVLVQEKRLKAGRERIRGDR